MAYTRQNYINNQIATLANFQAMDNGIAENSAAIAQLRHEHGVYNILDNSNFLNPVNQRGGTSGTNDTAAYTLDRWLVKGTYSVGASGIAVSGEGSELTQRVYTKLITAGKQYTLAVKRGNDVHVIVLTPSSTEATVTSGWSQAGVRHVLTSSYYSISLLNLGGAAVAWAALYEGAYTADTVPDYQHKDYEAELLECQRHYRTLRVLWGNDIGAPRRQLINFSPRMRVWAPTATATVATGGSQASATMTVNQALWDSVDVTGSGWGSGTVTLNAEM